MNEKELAKRGTRKRALGEGTECTKVWGPEAAWVQEEM